MATAQPRGQTKAEKAEKADSRHAEHGGGDDAIWDRRHQHRRAGLVGVYRSRDVVKMHALIAAGELSADAAPAPPDPNDRSVSKRQWELSTELSIVEGLQMSLSRS